MLKKSTTLMLATSLTVFTLAVLPMAAMADDPPAQPARHGDGSTGETPYRIRLRDGLTNHVELHNAEAGLTGWGLTTQRTLDEYLSEVRRAIRYNSDSMTRYSNNARTGLQNCDRPYFEANVANMETIIQRWDDVLASLNRIESHTQRVMERSETQLRSSVRNMDGGWSFGKALVLGVVNFIPFLGPTVGAAEDAVPNQEIIEVQELEARWTRMEEFLPRLAELKESTSTLIQRGRQDVQQLRQSFEPQACRLCRPEPVATEQPLPQPPVNQEQRHSAQFNETQVMEAANGVQEATDELTRYIPQGRNNMHPSIEGAGY